MPERRSIEERFIIAYWISFYTELLFVHYTKNAGAAVLPRPAFWFNPPSRLTAASEDELRSHLGELLEEGVVLLEALFGVLEHRHRLLLADLLDQLLEAEVFLGLHLAGRRELRK